MRRRELQNKATSVTLRARGIWANKMIGTGKAIRERFVIISQAPIVMRFTYPVRQVGPGSGVTCQ